MRLIFAGTPEVAVPALDALLQTDHDVVAVVTREDAPLGRKRTLTPSPVASAADAAGIRLIKANRLDDRVTAEIRALEPDLGVIVAYGGLVREPLLSVPAHGWINLHFSLLPDWRGAAPVQHALVAGDSVTGASVFQLVPALDAGDVYATLRHDIDPDATAGVLLNELSVGGAALLTRTVAAIGDGTAVAVQQDGPATNAPKLTIEDARLDPMQSATAVYNRFRGVTPEPGAFVVVGDSRLKIHEARRADDISVDAGVIVGDRKRVLLGTSTTAIELLTVQPAGKGRMPAVAWWRGRNDATGLKVG